MSVLYRALWVDRGQSDPAAYLAESLHRFSCWALNDAAAASLLEGSTEVLLEEGRHRTVDVRRVNDGRGRQGLEAVARDRNSDEATSWTTLMRVVLDPDGVHTLVENHMESDDLTLRISVGRPRVVDELLGIPGRPVLGGSAVFVGAQAIPANGISILTGLLSDPQRKLPVIVCSEPGGEHDARWLEWADAIATRVAGIACVLTLDGDAVTAFRRALGDLAIWGGGIRVYAPVAVGDASEGWRHRYTLRARLETAPKAMIDRIVYSVAQLSARRRVPESFNVFEDAASPSVSSLDGYLATELVEAQRAEWEFAVDLEIAERSEVEKELARATGHLARLKEELLARGLGEVLWGTQQELTASIPDEVQDTSEAVLAAQSYLTDWLGVPDGAGQELEVIDTAANSFAWGNTTWRGLRALAAYAEDRANGWANGGFWEWCAAGGPLTWPATTKKLSMTESESVQNSQKLMGTRSFPVDVEVDASGEITMLAHLKIAEGGGNLAPRVYFHDDTGGPTKKVHVGFVGPHYLVPNKQTN